MKKQSKEQGISRRETLKLSGLALGGAAMGVISGPGAATARAECIPDGPCYPTNPANTNRYSFFANLPEFDPRTPLEGDEMRVTFLGSMIPPPRRAQAEMSVFVEVGPWLPDEDDNVYGGRATDQFIFDCGSGVCANYGAASIGYRRMDKVFINHLHADHMSDLSHIYAFGPSGDRKSPLFVWGPGPSGVRSPRPPRRLYDDGTKAFCRNLREAMRWHSESFSFQGTAYESYVPPTREDWGLPCKPIPVGDDPVNDAFAMIPIELDWRKYGKVPGDNVAYDNQNTGVRITHFPVIHCRKGSIGYKLEWNGLSVIYTSDTKPEWHSVNQAINEGNGVDLFIHEMIVPPEVWAIKNMGIPAPPPPGTIPLFDRTVQGLKFVQDSSHTPQGAFGYLLSRIEPRPRLTVATHFPVADDTVACALNSVRKHCPEVVWDPESPDTSTITWSFDLMVIRVFPDRIEQRRARVCDFGFSPPTQLPSDPLTPKYHDADGNWDPYAQIDRSTEIPAYDEETGTWNYCDDGY